MSDIIIRSSYTIKQAPGGSLLYLLQPLHLYKNIREISFLNPMFGKAVGKDRQ
jgi:hypothetical protein